MTETSEEILAGEVGEAPIEKSEVKSSLNADEIARHMKNRGMTSFFCADESVSSHLVSLGYKKDTAKDDQNTRQWKS
jgi:hypothetical protein